MENTEPNGRYIIVSALPGEWKWRQAAGLFFKQRWAREYVAARNERGSEEARGWAYTWKRDFEKTRELLERIAGEPPDREGRVL